MNCAQLKFDPMRYPHPQQLDEFYLNVFTDCMDLVKKGVLNIAQANKIKDMRKSNTCFLFDKGAADGKLDKILS